MLTLLIGGGLVVAGFMLSRLPSRRKGPRPQKPPQPVCGCQHHHAFHDPETGQCHAMVDGKVTEFDDYDTPVAWERVQCSCRQYSGPVPLPEMFAPEIGG